MGYADLHIHSTFSDGVASPRQILEWVEADGGLDLIAITDHDELGGGLALREAWAQGRYRVGVIVGVELTTLEGHLLCYEIEHPIPSWRGLAWTIAQVHAQGGFAVVPHPGSPLTRSVGARGMARLLAHPDPACRPDGVELINPSLAGRAIFRQAVTQNRRWQLAATGGSDAHLPALIGSAGTFYPGSGAAAFRHALQHGKTAPAGRLWGWEDHLLMREAVGQVLGRALFWQPARLLWRALRTKWSPA